MLVLREQNCITLIEQCPLHGIIDNRDLGQETEHDYVILIDGSWELFTLVLSEAQCARSGAEQNSLSRRVKCQVFKYCEFTCS